MTPLARAAKICGSQKALAEQLCVSSPFLSQMTHGVRQIPPRLCLPIEQATGGKVTRYELRPDIFGSQPDSAA